MTDFDLTPTILLLTHAPDEKKTADGLVFARQFCEFWQKNSNQPIDLTLFFYGNGAYLANRLVWLPADMPNLAKDWQKLVKEFQLTAQVCVTTALARGVVDVENAQRHDLQGENLADGFALVGLGELAMYLHQGKNVKQF